MLWSFFYRICTTVTACTDAHSLCLTSLNCPSFLTSFFFFFFKWGDPPKTWNMKFLLYLLLFYSRTIIIWWFISCLLDITGVRTSSRFDYLLKFLVVPAVGSSFINTSLPLPSGWGPSSIRLSCLSRKDDFSSFYYVRWWGCFFALKVCVPLKRMNF